MTIKHKINYTIKIMKTVKTTTEGKNFTAVNIGKLSEVKDYVLPLGDIEIPGKVFVGQA